MAIKRMSVPFLGNRALVIRINAAVDTFNKTPNSVNLGVIEGLIDSVPRATWSSHFQALNVLESEIVREYGDFKKQAAGGGGAAVLGAAAKRDESPSKWLDKLRVDAPSLDGMQSLGDAAQGAQGTTFPIDLPGGAKLLAKVDRGADKNNAVVMGAETECAREYRMYRKVFEVQPDHPNLVKVWGWADLKLGLQHELGMVMDRIEGLSGRYAQQELKEAWDLGIVNSAEYWSCIQYIGRCHLKIIALLEGTGLVHNDIKPENYVVDARNGEVVVIDLGGAAAIGASPNAVTAEYLAPEMRRGKAPDMSAKATVASDVFAVGATLAHAVEAAQVFHRVAAPNQGVKVGKAVSINTPQGRVKNPFEQGVESAYTRQLNRMMADAPAERGKVFSEHASNQFFNDSILTDAQTRDVLKGVVSGSRKRDWEARWRKAGKAPPAATSVNKLQVQNDLENKMRALTKGIGAGDRGGIAAKRHQLNEAAGAIQAADLLMIDTKAYKATVKKIAKELDATEQDLNRRDQARPPIKR